MAVSPPGHKSLIKTLIWGLTLPTVAMIAITIAILANRLSGTVKGVRQTTLTSQAEDVIGYLSEDDGGALTLQLPDMLKELYAKPNDFAFVILDRSGTALFASHNLAPLEPIEPSPADEELSYFRIADANDLNPVYGATIRFVHGEQPYWIQVTQGGLHDDVLFDTVVEEFFETTGWVFIALLAALLGINIIIISRSLRPLKIAQAQAEAIGPSTTDIRLHEDGLSSEILPLVRAINSAFDRLEQGFQTQREFTANAAHELRTPLAVLTARIGKLDNKAEADLLHKDIRALNRIVGQLLKVSQLEAVSIGYDERVDLSAVAIETATYLGPIAIANYRSISVEGADNPVVIPGSGELMGHAVRNLVENALRHTPPQTAVEITVGIGGTISVSDEGPGIPAAEREQVFQRFWRSKRSEGGAGIGLTIVEGIVRAHGGKVFVTDNTNRNGVPCGAKFVIELPISVSGS